MMGGGGAAAKSRLTHITSFQSRNMREHLCLAEIHFTSNESRDALWNVLQCRIFVAVEKMEVVPNDF